MWLVSEHWWLYPLGYKCCCWLECWGDSKSILGPMETIVPLPALALWVCQEEPRVMVQESSWQGSWFRDARHSGHRPAFESWLFQLTLLPQFFHLPISSGCSVKRESGRRCQQLVLMCTVVLFKQGPSYLVGSHEPGGSCAHWSQSPSAVFKQASLLSLKAPPQTWPGTLILEGA